MKGGTMDSINGVHMLHLGFEILDKSPLTTTTSGVDGVGLDYDIE